VLSNVIENGKPIGNADAGRTWHTDMSYTKTPPRGSLLYALEIPIENGRALGDTVFASAAAAFESLPADKQASLLGLRAIRSCLARIMLLISPVSPSGMGSWPLLWAAPTPDLGVGANRRPCHTAAAKAPLHQLRAPTGPSNSTRNMLSGECVGVRRGGYE
jgi:hypothetical protein